MSNEIQDMERRLAVIQSECKVYYFRAIDFGCDSCKFFQAETLSNPRDGVIYADTGHCRKNPPTLDQETWAGVFPKVKAEDWCGAHEKTHRVRAQDEHWDEAEDLIEKINDLKLLERTEAEGSA